MTQRSTAREGAAKRAAAGIHRRGFLGGLLAAAAAAVTGRSVLGANSIATPLFVPQESRGADVVSTMVKYPGEGATLQGYLSRPRSAGPFPAVIVVGEGGGFNESACGAARSLASDGHVTLVVDLLSRQGGSAFFAPASSAPSFVARDAARAFASLREDDILRDVEAARRYLRSHPAVLPESIRVMSRGQGGSSRLPTNFQATGLPC